MTPRLLALALLVATSTLALPARAVGRLADVTVTDRDTGATLALHHHRGEYWVAGRPGARYAITVRNRLGERILAVPAVDGVNVLSGETAAWDQTGYVLSPGQPYQITGWRKSSSEIAAFEFSSAGDSYAGRTGRPDHVGVIGVALFRERRPEPAVLEPDHAVRDNRQRQEESRSFQRGAPPPASPATGLQERNSSEALAQHAPSSTTDSLAKAAPLPAPRLGTGHGQREVSVISHTRFERLQASPNEIIRIRYDSRENLVAAGVIREPVLYPRLPTPSAFPNSGNTSYVPDPPSRF
ncbi:MAG: hypothetical protein H0W47_09070 [Polaromonas sp.]|uniref:hypothetical protein n=1 Tax=Polaromonas sp. TaxID=1869339 RepID=UPI0017D241BC|nr:hypothetical protein [Polaromonas sp.]MBA3593936.1 hypothetical protein [Polaromonas sp.]